MKRVKREGTSVGRGPFVDSSDGDDWDGEECLLREGNVAGFMDFVLIDSDVDYGRAGRTNKLKTRNGKHPRNVGTKRVAPIVDDSDENVDNDHAGDEDPDHGSMKGKEGKASKTTSTRKKSTVTSSQAVNGRW